MPVFTPALTSEVLLHEPFDDDSGHRRANDEAIGRLAGFDDLIHRLLGNPSPEHRGFALRDHMARVGADGCNTVRIRHQGEIVAQILIDLGALQFEKRLALGDEIAFVNRIVIGGDARVDADIHVLNAPLVIGDRRKRANRTVQAPLRNLDRLDREIRRLAFRQGRHGGVQFIDGSQLHIHEGRLSPMIEMGPRHHGIRPEQGLAILAGDPVRRWTYLGDSEVPAGDQKGREGGRQPSSPIRLHPSNLRSHRSRAHQFHAPKPGSRASGSSSALGAATS